MNGEWKVYILELKKKNVDTPRRMYYVGITRNFDRRLKEHIAGRSKFTSRFNVMGGIVVLSNIQTESEARQFELKYKNFSHEKKETLYLFNKGEK